MGMSYTNFLEYENKQLKDENEKLKKEKTTVYKWGYSLEKDYKLLKEQINTSQTSRLIAENNRLNEICIYWEQQYNELKQENEQLKQENTQLKHKNNQQAKTIDRLIKIITDEHYN